MNKLLFKMANCRFIAVLVLAIAMQHSASGLQGEQELFTTQRPIFSGSDSDKNSWSLVNVDRKPDGSKVDVHVPLIFDMTNDKSNGGSRLDLSVLGGLVTVNRDKPKQPDGASTGPMTVTVFGIPVYSGFGGGRGPLRRLSDYFASSSSSSERKTRSEPTTDPPTTLVVITKKEKVTEAPLVSTIKKTNEKVLQSLADGFGKVSTFVTQASPVANTNGRPAEKSDGFVGLSRFHPTDFEPKIRSLYNKSDKTAHESLIYA